MRIGLNATCFDERPSGANQRFRNIYGALIRNNPDVEYVVYEPCDVPVASWFADAPNVTARRTPVPSIGRLARLRAGAGFWRGTLKHDRLDMFEMFHLPLVEAADCPTILTVHDLRPVLPDRPLLQRLVAGAVLHRGFAHADRVITVSNVMRDEIEAFHPGSAVTTIYNGVDLRRFGALDPAAARSMLADWSLPDRFLLTVGHLEARKNLKVLVDAVAMLREGGRTIPLVIAGNDAGEKQHLEAQIARLGLGASITLVSQASDEQIRALYAAAHLVVFPSNYEGFGIPVIEAMASARALVLSDIAVFRELMQDSGSFFPPNDAAAAATAIAEAWTNESLRADMITFGRRRLEDFCFDRLAEQVSALHRSLA
jgi:glycosyltransferase involved in cell wall biosynthesis